jgi:hypothetical protein
MAYVLLTTAERVRYQKSLSDKSFQDGLALKGWSSLVQIVSGFSGSSQATVRCRPLLGCPIYRWLVTRNPFWMIPSASGSDRKFLQHCATVPGCTFREIRPTDRRRCVCKHKWKSISHNWYLMHSAKRSDTTTWYDWYEYQNHWAPAPPPKNRWFDRMFNKTSSAIGSRKISQHPNAASYKAPGVQLLNAVAQIWHPATQRLQACHGWKNNRQHCRKASSPDLGLHIILQ